MKDNRLKVVRAELGITQKQLSEAIGGDISHVGKIEIGQARLTPAFARRLKKAFPRVNTEYLLLGEGEPLLPEREISEDERRKHLIESIRDVFEQLDPAAQEVIREAILGQSKKKREREESAGGENRSFTGGENMENRKVA